MSNEERTIKCPGCGAEVVIPEDELESVAEPTPSTPIPDDS